MNYKHSAKLGLTLLASLVLAACGSSGGGDSGSAPADNQAQHKPANPKPSTNNQTSSQPQTGSETGGALVISSTNDRVNIKREGLNAYETNALNVDGKTITIGYPGIHSYSWSNMKIKASNKEFHVCCGRYSDMRFGAVGSLTENANDYFFYNGNPTKNMPTSGSATYIGQSIISADSDILPEDYHTGSSQFNVDFGNKTLNGSLNIENIKPVNVNATISGNAFAGKANTSSLPAEARVEGKFYGNAAKELAGLAQANDNSWGASFGAQKQ